MKLVPLIRLKGHNHYTFPLADCEIILVSETDAETQSDIRDMDIKYSYPVRNPHISKERILDFVKEANKDFKMPEIETMKDLAERFPRDYQIFLKSLEKDLTK